MVTKGEYDLVAAALKTMHGKVQDQSQQTRNTLRYANNDPAYLQTVTDLNKESRNLLDSLQRLKIQNRRQLTLIDVYGSAAQSPNLEAALHRWKGQRENNLKVQIAMIPQQDDGDLMFSTRIGAPHTLDIDSIV
ncbi:hypothetical protein [Pseudomonas synxantha]|uniref:hypothetical protein n=1 Tax=Pseudomonas synxantha TaxID=47883 RepID=UPI00345CCDFE